MRPVIIIFCIISLLLVRGVHAEPDDFLNELEQALLNVKEVKVPLEKITDFNILKKSYVAPATAIQDTITLLNNIKHSKLDNGAEIRRELALAEKQYADAMALDAPKNKSLDSAGKVRNEALHERLAYLRKQKDILRNAKAKGIDKAIQMAKQEGSNILAALNRQLVNKIIPAPTQTYIDPPQDLQPTPQTSDKMRRYLAERTKKGTKNAFPVSPDDGFMGLFPSDETLMHRLRPTKPIGGAAPVPMTQFILPISSESAKILSFAKGAGKAVSAVGVVTVAYDIAVENDAEYALTKYMEVMKECRTLQTQSVFTTLWGRVKQAGVTIGIHTGMDDIAQLLSDGITKGNFNEDVKRELRDGISYIKKNCPEAFATLKADARFIDGLNDMEVRTAANPLILEIKQAPMSWWRGVKAPRSVP